MRSVAFHTEIMRAAARNEKDRRRCRQGLEHPAHLEAAHVGEHHVQQDQIRSELLGRLPRGAPVDSFADDDEARLLEQPPAQPAEARMVVDDQDRPAHAAIVTRKWPRTRQGYP